MDDSTARTEARRLGITARGTLGILVQSYRHQHLGLSETEFLIEELAERPDIWISEMLCRQVLAELRGEAKQSR
jgi:predicted nucleic acid-binding protein